MRGQAGAGPSQRGEAYKWLSLGVVVIGSFMSFLDSTVLNVAIPKLMSVFSADVHQAEWVLTSYLLALATVIPITGYLCDTYGTKRMYAVTLSLFTIGSFLCGASWNVWSMVAFRVIQGLGGGGIQPIGMNILFRTFDPSERGKAMGWYGITTMAGPALGPTFGGYLVEYVDWRLIFYINIPVGIAAVLAANALLDETPRTDGLRLDVVGLALATLGTSLTLLGFVYGPVDGWGDTAVVLELTTGLALLGAFVVTELVVEHPLLELRLFRIWSFSNATFVMIIVAISLWGATFMLPLFLETLRDLGPMEVGVLMLPQFISSAAAMPVAGRVTDRFGPRASMVPGMAILILATYAMSRLSLDTPDWSLQITMICRGFGMSLTWIPATTAAMAGVPRNLISSASSLTNAMQRIASSFGTALAVTILQVRQEHHYAALAELVTPWSLPARQVAAQVMGAGLQHGMSAGEASRLALVRLTQVVQRQSMILSFDDTFFLTTLMCLPALVAALLIGDTRRAARAPDQAGAPAHRPEPARSPALAAAE